MYKLKEFLNLMEEFAPLSLSYKMIERGDYDNSGIIVENHDQVKGVLFSLDLSEEAVFRAIKEGANTIVTHHPAIYMPIKNLSSTGETKALLLAIKNNINVISMHLNLDVAENGIDKCLSECLGAKESVVLDVIDKNVGYGRAFKIDKISITEFTEKLNKKLNTNKIIFYGEREVEQIASFCGAGGSHAVSVLQDAAIKVDTIVTSDIQHHQLLALIEKGLNVIIIPHYIAEEYGFNKFYEFVLGKVKMQTKAYYFQDKRFM